MKRMVLGGAAVLLVTGCGRPASLSGPAPAGALECAVAHGIAAGYALVDGDAESGFVRLSQRLPPPPAEPPQPPTRTLQPEPLVERPGDQPVENQILVTRVGSRLEISFVGVNEAGTEMAPGGTVEGHARTIQSLCTADPPVLPPVGGG